MRQLLMLICAFFSITAIAQTNVHLFNFCKQTIRIVGGPTIRSNMDAELHLGMSGEKNLTIENNDSTFDLIDTDDTCSHRDIFGLIPNGWFMIVSRDFHRDSRICIQQDQFMSGGNAIILITDNNHDGCHVQLKNTGEYPSDPSFYPIEFNI